MMYIHVFIEAINMADEIFSTSDDTILIDKRLQFLRALLQLRNFKPEILEKIMDSLAKYLSVEKDILYLMGEKKGIEKGKDAVIKNLLLDTDFTVKKIAALSEVSEYYVRKVKGSLNRLNSIN